MKQTYNFGVQSITSNSHDYAKPMHQTVIIQFIPIDRKLNLSIALLLLENSTCVWEWIAFVLFLLKQVV